MSNTLKHVTGDRFPLIQVTLKDRNTVDSDPADPDTWDVVDISVNVQGVRIDYFQADFQLTDIAVANATDLFTKVDHKLVDDDRVRFSPQTTIPQGLSEDTLYYVITATDDTFQVSASEGGTAVVLSDDGAGQLNAIKQFDTAVGTIIGGGTGGQFTFVHPTLVWENPGCYDLEYLVRFDTGKETVFDRDQLEIRSR